MILQALAAEEEDLDGAEEDVVLEFDDEDWFDVLPATVDDDELRASEEASDSDDSWFPTPSLRSTPPTPAAVHDPIPQSPPPFSLSEEAPRKHPRPTVEEVVDEDDPGEHHPSLRSVLT